VKVPTVPNFMDISLDDQAICDTSLTMLAEAILTSEDKEIKKGIVFDSLEHL
jgi:hypothetical protein